MNKPKSLVKNTIVYNEDGSLIIRNESEEFGTSFYVFTPYQFSALNFNSLGSAMEHIASQKRQEALRQ